VKLVQRPVESSKHSHDLRSWFFLMVASFIAAEYVEGETLRQRQRAEL
jgi:hypothetical protein